MLKSNKITILLNGQDDGDLKIAAQMILSGKIVALPTETVYGLAANGLCEESVRKIFIAKKRPENNPIILHVRDSERAKNLYIGLNLRQLKWLDKLSEKFWPGPLTVIAPKNPQIPNLVTANMPSIAVRVPNSKITQRILELTDLPLAMPSANLSTRPSPTCAEHVLETLDEQIDGVVFGEPSFVGIESTVISLLEQKPVILRPGLISQEEIEHILKEEIIVAKKDAKEKALSPGQSYLHYAPKVTSIRVIEEDLLTDYWLTNSSLLLSEKQYNKALENLGPRPQESFLVTLKDSPEEYARELYNAFYEFEKRPTKNLIIILPKEKNSAWAGIIDRLNRASGMAES